MSRWKRAAHARYQLGYHFAWSPKYRKGILEGKARKEFLAEVLRGVGERYAFEVTKIGIADDHLYLFIEAAPRYAPAELVKIIKSPPKGVGIYMLSKTLRERTERIYRNSCI